MREGIESAYRAAQECYHRIGVDCSRALDTLATVPISLNCWNGDDVTGFEHWRSKGTQNVISGNYPGRARNLEQLRQDLAQVYQLLPGRHRLNLHACYLDSTEQPDRNQLEAKHFLGWAQWAQSIGLQGLDFNPTFFSHSLAASNLTLAHPDPAVRHFWIEHGRCCRRISTALGQAMGSRCFHNIWIIDGYKDVPVDRLGPRMRLKEALDEILAEALDPQWHFDVVESKLFSIAVESYTVGSHEFYLAYALSKGIGICLDMGHFHPTEQVSHKLSALLPFFSAMVLHLSRPVRWDSDHVVILDDELREVALELVRGNFISRVGLGLDFFDASINRLAAWIIGARSVQQALLYALLEPTDQLRKIEIEGDYTSRLALLEQQKIMPFGAVWNYFCWQQNVPLGAEWLSELKQYEKQVLSRRDTGASRA